ncbi:MAG: PilZ domain-containing protein [Candidatus Acidiferrales bacterium]
MPKAGGRMYDHDEKLKGATSASQAERRGSNRHPFIAAADVVELGTGAVFSTRTTDLGPGGCFVDTLVPFDAGSHVRVTIREGSHRFEATGIVVYSQSGLGMGIAFDDIKPEQRKTLAIWLGEEVSQREEQPVAAAPPAKPKPMLPHGSDRESLVRLVRLMIKKGILTEPEATAIFGNPMPF